MQKPVFGGPKSGTEIVVEGRGTLTKVYAKTTIDGR